MGLGLGARGPNDRTGLFNGLIPITSVAAVALTGTGTITPLQVLAALTVLVGVSLGLGRTRQNPASTVNQADQRPRADRRPVIESYRHRWQSLLQPVRPYVPLRPLRPR